MRCASANACAITPRPIWCSPIRFLFPIYRGRGFGRLTMDLGLWLYDIFARTAWSERHRG